jgi:hypothetical protein
MTNTECHFCKAKGPRINGNHWAGSAYIRVDICDSCYDDKRLASAPRRARKPRSPRQIPASDWNMLVAMQRGMRG